MLTCLHCIIFKKYINTRQESEDRFRINDKLPRGFDDVFQMHEKMFSDIRYIPEQLFFLAYFVCIVFIVIVCFKTFLQTDFVLWSLALLMFAMSLVVDREIIRANSDHAFWEDSFKFTGIVLWTAYYLRTAMSIIVQQIQEVRK